MGVTPFRYYRLSSDVGSCFPPGLLGSRRYHSLQSGISHFIHDLLVTAYHSSFRCFDITTGPAQVPFGSPIRLCSAGFWLRTSSYRIFSHACTR
jgi:hypothetical protein